MKSRLYFGTRIDCSTTMRPLAVVIVESTEDDRYNQLELENIFDTDEMRHLEIFVKGMQPFIPTQTLAQNAGY